MKPEGGSSYEILEGGAAIRCKRCGLTSHNPNDVEQRFCSKCKRFHHDLAPRCPSLHVFIDGDQCWPDLDLMAPEVHNGGKISVAALPGGMSSGAPSLTIRVDTDDGLLILAETSLALFLTAAEAFKAKYGDPRR